jgi:hypothetical protein
MVYFTRCPRAGEVFGGLHVPPGASDAATLFAALQDDDESSPRTQDNGAGPDHGHTARRVVALLSTLRGPWSVGFWSAASRVSLPCTLLVSQSGILAQRTEQMLL